jgi:hypothetical protein
MEQGLGWLRLASAATDTIPRTFWNGAVDAEKTLPASIQRPRLLRWNDWTSEPWAYRAELYEHVPTPTISQRNVLTSQPALSSAWWDSLRATLGKLSTTQTERCAADQEFLTWALPRYLGKIEFDDEAPWVTAHGDLHYANLCAPLSILDWEGWGKAPTGYDAATLHSHSLLVPSAAAKIRHELAEHLDTPAGQFAELVVITELLHAAANTPTPLTEPLRRRAETLLHHPVPQRNLRADPT